MPKKVEKTERQIYTIFKNRFKIANKENTRIYENYVTVKFQGENFSSQTNLDYYRKHGVTDESERIEFEKLKLEEAHKIEVYKKHTEYHKTFDDFRKTYQSLISMQEQRIELDDAKKHQEKLIQEASKNGNNLELDPIEVNVDGYEETRQKFYDLYNVLNKQVKEIDDLDISNELETNINNKINEVKEELNKERIKKEEERKNDPKEKERIQKEEELKRQVKEKELQEAEKRKKEAEKQQQIKDYNDRKDTIEKLESSAYDNTIDSNKEIMVDNLFSEYGGNNLIAERKKFTLYGSQEKVTLKDAMNKFKESYINSVTEGLHSRQEETFLDHSARFDRGFNKGINEVNSRIPDNLKVKERQDQFAEVSDYNAKEMNFEQDSFFNPEKTAELAALTNRLAQIHHKASKPNFFSRLFKTQYYRAYSREEGMIEFYKDKLSGLSKLNRDYVNKITDKATCYDPIDKKEFLDNFYEGYKKNHPNTELFKTSEELTKDAESLVKMKVVKSIFENKEPTAEFNTFFKRHDDYLKETMERNKIEKPVEEVKEEVKENIDPTRQRIEIEELANPKQGLENDDLDYSKDLSLVKEEPQKVNN